MKRKPKVVDEKKKEAREAPPPENIIFSYRSAGEGEEHLRARQEEKLKKWVKKKLDEVT